MKANDGKKVNWFQRKCDSKSIKLFFEVELSAPNERQNLFFFKSTIDFSCFVIAAPMESRILETKIFFVKYYSNAIVDQMRKS